MKHCRKFFTPLLCRDQRSGTGSACKCNSAEKTFCLAGSLNVLRDVVLLGQSQKKLQCMLPLVKINLKWLMMVRQFLSGHQCQKMKWRWAVASYCCCTSPPATCPAPCASRCCWPRAGAWWHQGSQPCLVSPSFPSSAFPEGCHSIGCMMQSQDEGKLAAKHHSS